MFQRYALRLSFAPPPFKYMRQVSIQFDIIVKKFFAANYFKTINAIGFCKVFTWVLICCYSYQSISWKRSWRWLYSSGNPLSWSNCGIIDYCNAHCSCPSLRFEIDVSTLFSIWFDAPVVKFSAPINAVIWARISFGVSQSFTEIALPFCFLSGRGLNRYTNSGFPLILWILAFMTSLCHEGTTSSKHVVWESVLPEIKFVWARNPLRGSWRWFHPESFPKRPKVIERRLYYELWEEPSVEHEL